MYSEKNHNKLQGTGQGKKDINYIKETQNNIVRESLLKVKENKYVLR